MGSSGFVSSGLVSSAFLVTVISHDADFVPAAAVIVALPSDTAVTKPSLTVAIVSSEEVHVTVLSSVAVSGLTVAVSSTVSPSTTVASVLSRDTEVIAIVFSFTVTVQVAVFSPAAAVMVAVPAALAVTVPFSTEAMSGLSEVHTILSVLSAGLTVAFSTSVSPTLSSSAVLSSSTLSAGTSLSVTLTVHLPTSLASTFAIRSASPTSTA